MDSEKDLIKEMFKTYVCTQINCGSQRCDCSDEWLIGCTLFNKFKSEINSIIDKFVHQNN